METDKTRREKGGFHIMYDVRMGCQNYLIFSLQRGVWHLIMSKYGERHIWMLPNQRRDFISLHRRRKNGPSRNFRRGVLIPLKKIEWGRDRRRGPRFGQPAAKYNGSSERAAMWVHKFAQGNLNIPLIWSPNMPVGYFELLSNVIAVTVSSQLSKVARTCFGQSAQLCQHA